MDYYYNLYKQTAPHLRKSKLPPPPKRAENKDGGGCNLECSLLFVLVCALGGSFLYVNSKLYLTGYVDYTERHNQVYVKCGDVTIFEPVNGKVDFIVTIDDLYPERKVLRSGGCFEGERLLRAAGIVMWHGTQDLNVKEIPLTVFAFESDPLMGRGRGYRETDRRHYFELKCPNFEYKLKEARSKWLSANNDPNSTALTKHEDQFKEPQKLGALSCSKVHVHNHGAHDSRGWVTVSALIKNPYRKEGTAVSKYPMSIREEIVLSGEYLMWYSSYNLRLNTDGLLPKTIFAFENANSTIALHRHYYEMSCPDLEKQLRAASFHWWKNEKLWTTWCTFALVSTISSLTCCFGMCCGEKRGREKALKSLGRKLLY